jgi:hypothetical protein
VSGCTQKRIGTSRPFPTARNQWRSRLALRRPGDGYTGGQAGGGCTPRNGPGEPVDAVFDFVARIVIGVRVLVRLSTAVRKVSGAVRFVALRLDADTEFLDRHFPVIVMLRTRFAIWI